MFNKTQQSTDDTRNHLGERTQVDWSRHGKDKAKLVWELQFNLQKTETVRSMILDTRNKIREEDVDLSCPIFGYSEGVALIYPNNHISA